MSTDGELWTRRELERLRAGSYRPRAWAGLIGRSLERSRLTTRARPKLARRARLWGATAVLASMIIPPALRRAGLPSPARRSMLAWTGAEYLMLRWHLGMVERDDGSAAMLGPADALTLARAWVAPLALRAPGAPLLALALLSGSALSDFADGRLARRAGPTRLGASLDPAADAALLAAFAVGTRRADLIAPGAALALQARLALPAALASWRYFAGAAPPPAAWRVQTRFAAAPVYAGIGLAIGGRPGAGSLMVSGGSAAALVRIAASARSSVSGDPSALRTRDQSRGSRIKDRLGSALRQKRQ